jgi:hypothetical protein
MANQNLDRLKKWLGDNRENALALIEKHNANRDEVLYYALARTYPPAILKLIPIIGMIVEVNMKIYLIAVTRKNFFMIRLKRFAVDEIAFQSIPIETILESTIDENNLLYNLRLVLVDGKKLLFKDMIKNWASGLKHAIDAAQGQTPLSFDKSQTKL